MRKAGRQGDGSVILLNGRRVQPSGITVQTGTFPLNATISPLGIVAVVNSGGADETLPQRAAAFGLSRVNQEWQSIDFVDPVTGKVLFTLPVPSTFFGAVWHPEGQTLFVSGGGRDLIRVIRYFPETKTAYEERTLKLFGYPTGLTITSTGSSLYAALMHRHAVVEVDPHTGGVRRRFTTEAAPYFLLLDEEGQRLYVSNWSSNTVTVVDLTSGSTRTVEVGKNPEGMALSPDRSTLYVAVSDEDRVALVSTQDLSVKSWDIRFSPEDPVGISPTDLSLGPDGLLYLTAAYDNAVYVFDPGRGGVRVGAIPAAMHPTRIFFTPLLRRFIIVNAKGFGSGANPNREFVGGLIRGILQIVPVPDATTMSRDLTNVQRFNDILANLYGDRCAGEPFPVPLRWNQKSPMIRHVIFIMRENKTYDSLLGDLGPEHDGDPNLVLFGEEITPNLHRLARRFANLTNFYNESEQSVQGHVWGAVGWVNDFTEKNWIAMWGRPGEAQLIVPGLEPASMPKTGDLFRHYLNHRVSVRVYGEYIAAALDAREGTDLLEWRFPSNLGIDDRIKIKPFLRDLALGKLADYTFIALPNDHTYGLTPGMPTPEYLVADNDEATGKIVEAVSHSPFWPETAIFIFEDDPQGTPDHVDAHRSICIVVSPWVKRGYVSRVHYSFPSLHKTAALILGVPPLTRIIAQAAAMHDVFTTDPDFTPYVAVPSRVPYALNPEEGPLAEASKKLDFTTVDRAPGLGRILWAYRKGTPFPEHLADDKGEEEEE